MAAVPATLVLFVYFTLASTYTLLRDDDNEIIWPSEYHFKGEKLNFMTSQKETFEIWYSAERNRSRMDVFDGTVRKWYYADTGYAYEIHPFTDEEVTNEDICISMATEDEQPDFLPSAYGLTYTGQSLTLYDKVVDIWTRTDDYGVNSTWETTLYVFKTDSGIDVPVQQVEKEYNYIVGKLASHIITNYFDFRDTVTDGELTLDTVQGNNECEEQELGKDFHKDIKLFHPDLPSELDLAFHLYTNHHNKLYQDQEHQMRKRIFEKNWRMIDHHNHKNLGYRLELNSFSDKTPEELKYLTGSHVPKRKDPDMLPFPHTLMEVDELVQELPESFDLRMEGEDTPVKNQGECGSCWAFCTNTAIEGALARVNGDRLLDLSEQSLVDCGWGFGTTGCNGGWPTDAMKYVMTHGVPTEMDYGIYKGIDSYCKIQNMTTTYKIRGFSQVTIRNPNAMKVTLFKYGPVTVLVHVTDRFMHYSSGVFYDLNCDKDGAEKELGHCVTVVGYGVRDGDEYWIVKNSWGEDWGEDGYILMAARNNNCFVLDSAIYAIV